MIRRDYILRMIEEFIQILSRIKGLKEGQHWEDAQATLDQELERLIPGGVQGALELSEIELLSKLIQGDPTQSVRMKTFALAALLKEAGDLAVAQESEHKSYACYLKGLHLLLHALSQGNTDEFPEFVPKVAAFLTCLENSVLPLETLALLVQHYERLGEFGKAEDALFTMIETEPKHSGLLDFGIAFYHRLQTKSDASLITGNLPRSELEAGLGELERRKAGHF